MRIGIVGYTGRMGRQLVKELTCGHNTSLELAGVSGRTVRPEAFPVFNCPEDLFKISDCVIDFTSPAITLDHIELAVRHGKKLVLGTTGLEEVHYRSLADAGKKTTILQSANTSIGVNLLLALVEQAAARLGAGWDIEISETHHRNKIDAPSGTALALGQAARKGRNGGDFCNDRAGKRKDGDIGYAVSRGGDVVGEHMVTFYGVGERLELGHKAGDRALFAKGALKAAQWLNDKPPGLYTMRDVLGL